MMKIKTTGEIYTKKCRFKYKKKRKYNISSLFYFLVEFSNVTAISYTDN